MKRYLLIIGLSVLLHSPLAAMHHHHAAPAPSYTKMAAVVGGIAVAAGYVCAWAKDLYDTEVALYKMQKFLNDKKIYRWCIQKYDPSRPMEHERNSATYTNYSAIYEDKCNYAAFEKAVEQDLMIDYNKGVFGYVEDSQAKYAGDKQTQIYQYLLDCIKKEKSELEPHLDTLVNMSKYFGGWYNIRKEYKWIAAHNRVLFDQQWQWSHKDHHIIHNDMASVLHTNLFQLFLGRSMYGRIARAYWDLEKCYQRLEKIERCLINKLAIEMRDYVAQEERIKQWRKSHEKPDQSFKYWLASFFFSAAE